MASYNGIFEAYITTTLIYFNEEWDLIMIEQFPEKGYLVVVWHFVVITLGLTIVAKYFMTSIIYELDAKINQDVDTEN